MVKQVNKYKGGVINMQEKILKLIEELMRLGEEAYNEFDIGEISDGYHTFNELYEYRKLYNALIFNEWSKQNLYDVHKSRLHHNGDKPFNSDEWFIVLANLPTGQISNHYHIDDWNIFKIKKEDKALFPYDNHTSEDVLNRMKNILLQDE